MKTLFIFTISAEFLPRFFVHDGDYSHLNNIVIDKTKDNYLDSLTTKEKELLKILGGTLIRIDLLNIFPDKNSWDIAIVCGCYVKEKYTDQDILD